MKSLATKEKIIAKSLGDFKGQKFSIKAPHFCQESDYLTELNSQLAQANTSHQNLLTELQEKISTKTLNADQLIASLLEKSINLEIPEPLVRAAQSRVSRQHPPGKQGSIGDAIHWETLLQHADTTSLKIVTGDADFASDLNTYKIRDVLEAEWIETKGLFSSISLFKSISSFFKKHYPDISLSDEIEKKSLIDQLEGSENFSTTHTVVAALNMFTYFTDAQIVRLFQILHHNTQVGWIGTDDDLQELFSKFQPRAYLVPSDISSSISNLLDVDEENFFFPF